MWYGSTKLHEWLQFPLSCQFIHVKGGFISGCIFFKTIFWYMFHMLNFKNSRSTGRFAFLKKNPYLLILNCRYRIFLDPYPHHINTHRQFAPPSPPPNCRRLFWTAPNISEKLDFWLSIPQKGTSISHFGNYIIFNDTSCYKKN